MVTIDDQVIDVMMLEVLRPAFEDWLESRGLRLAHVPDTPETTFVVILAPVTVERES